MVSNEKVVLSPNLVLRSAFLIIVSNIGKKNHIYSMISIIILNFSSRRYRFSFVS